jgi:hypothetical protein
MDATNRPAVGHETTDVNVWAVAKFAIGLVLLCTVSLVLLFGLLRFFQSQEETATAPTVEPTKMFPEPQLQKAPVQDLKTVRSEEDKLLGSYGWVDQKKGIVRIPVSLAIDALAKRGMGGFGTGTPSEGVKK